jgi:hypothetical protein
MSAVVVPLAIGTVGVILIVVLVFVIFGLVALAYGLSTRGKSRQVKADAEREPPREA